MKRLLTGAWIGVAFLSLASEVEHPVNHAPTVVIVVGAPGEPDYGQKFEASARALEEACRKTGAHPITIGLDKSPSASDLEQLKSLLKEESLEPDRELWLILLGHGTFDGKEAKFNLRGPDLSATDLAQFLEPVRRPLAFINTSSSSGPFLKALSGNGRVIVTATRSGYEQNYARFGEYFATAITSSKADLDKDGQVSLLEAFLTAAHDVAEFYKTEGRLATEHSLLDDNGDGLGTPPDWFRGVRAVKKPVEGASMDGLRAHQFHLVRSEVERNLSPALRIRRNELELAVEELRGEKEKLGADEYYDQLESLMLDLAELYEASDKQ